MDQRPVETRPLSELPSLLTFSETARVLRVSPRTVRRMVEDGRLASVRVGRATRITRDPMLTGLGLLEDQKPRRDRRQSKAEYTRLALKLGIDG